MSLCKVLLLSCIVMTHLALMASRPVGQDELRKKLHNMKISFGELKDAETNYIDMMFDGEFPQGLEPIEGITWPVRNTTEEILKSSCAIIHYLGEPIKKILNATLIENSKNLIHGHIKKFRKQFIAAVGQNACTPNQSHRNVALDDFSGKQTGLQILHYARLWVEHIANVTIHSH